MPVCVSLGTGSPARGGGYDLIFWSVLLSHLVAAMNEKELNLDTAVGV